MTKRIFRTIFLVAVIVFLTSAVLFMTVLYNYFSGLQQSQLRIQTDLAAQGVLDGGRDYLEGLAVRDDRITWIGTDGKVLYDSKSDPKQMENHFAREEVKEALAEGYGESARYSSTLTQRYLYCAKRLPDGTVLRLATAQHSLLVLTLGMVQPLCIIFLIVLALSVVLAHRLSKKIVKPLNALNLDEPLSNDGYDELSPLLRRIDMQQREIKHRSDVLRQKQEEFEVLTASMAEGIILLDPQGTILSINQAAARLLDTDRRCTGQDILDVNRTPKLSAILEKAKQGNRAETVLAFGEGIYQLDASPVVSDGDVSGIVLLILDVTEREQAEQRRREFTANVSHELKTPLHTISGSAELLENGLVKPEDVSAFAGRIYGQAQHMSRLIEDILQLSHLDEGAGDLDWETVDLYALAGETVQALSDAAREKTVQLTIQGQPVYVSGVRQLLREMLDNLCDNAIKYNRTGGSVQLTVQEEDGDAVLSVADTGIGIPAAHQSRIFERFYRVDKSHSKEIGGTGLGLSIVKHAAMLHHAKLTLQSAVNEGTTVTVRFPKTDEE